MKRSTIFATPATCRTFVQSLACAGLAWGVRADAAPVVGGEELARVLDRPVLDVSFVKRPVKIASVELFRAGRVYLVRTSSTDGVEAITVPNPARMALMYPLFLKQIVPVFIGKDARDLERLLWDVYRHDSNYSFYEEPCEFDDLWSTKEVADALTIPVAGGEQEFSLHRWRWMIANARWTLCSRTCTMVVA